MNDLLGNTLSIGDTVAIPNGSGSLGSMRLGRIARMGEKMVIVEPIPGNPNSVRRSRSQRYFQDVIRVGGPDA